MDFSVDFSQSFRASRISKILKIASKDQKATNIDQR